MDYQRSIEAVAHKGWQSNAGDSRGLGNPDPRLKGRRTTGLEMLREDSAYEMYPGYRNAIIGVRTFWDKSFIHVWQSTGSLFTLKLSKL